jgi:hypothetical protein
MPKICHRKFYTCDPQARNHPFAIDSIGDIPDCCICWCFVIIPSSPVVFWHDVVRYYLCPTSNQKDYRRQMDESRRRRQQDNNGGDAGKGNVIDKQPKTSPDPPEMEMQEMWPWEKARVKGYPQE